LHRGEPRRHRLPAPAPDKAEVVSKVVGRAGPARVVQGARVDKAAVEAGLVLPVKLEDPVPVAERGDKREAKPMPTSR
jgi:hypothetical protein